MKKKSADMLILDIMMNLTNVVPLDRLNEVKNILYVHLGDKEIYASGADDTLPAVQDDDTFKLIDTWGQCLRLEGKSEGTIMQYQTETRNFFLSVKKHYSEVVANDIRAYLSWRQMKGCKETTINNKMCCIRAFYFFVEKEDLIEDGGFISRKPKVNPMAKIKNAKTVYKMMQVFTDEQVEEMRDHCENERDLAIVLTLSSTGMRVGELVQINKSDIDMDTGECIIHGKGKKDRFVYLSAAALVHLKRYLAGREDDDPALFVGSRERAGDKRIKSHAIRSMLKKVAERSEKLDGAKVSPHAFRRYVATSLNRRGAKVEDIQLLLGHKNPDTTLKCYIKRDAHSVKGICEKYAV